MNITNKHIILIILTIIILAFIYNYDVYIVEKNVPICKPIFVTKSIITPETENLLLEKGIVSNEENMDLVDNEVIEGFNTLMTQQPDNINLNIPGNILSSFSVLGVTDVKKVKVIDNVIKVLSNIPTNMDIDSIKQIIEYFGMIYQTSPNLSIFYKNVSSSTKIKMSPYNTKYAQLVLFLIGKFNNDVEECIEKPNGNCNFNKHQDNKQTNNNSEYLQELKTEIINKIVPEITNEITNEIINKNNKNKNQYQENYNPLVPSKPNYQEHSQNMNNPVNLRQEKINNEMFQEEKPCYDKCQIRCPVLKLKKEPFGLIQSNDNGTDYYSLLN